MARPSLSVVKPGVRVVLLTLLLYGGVLGLFVVSVSAVLRAPEGGGLGFGSRVAVVELEGIILDVDDLVRDLKSHRDNPLVRSVVLRINSPGGPERRRCGPPPLPGSWQWHGPAP